MCKRLGRYHKQRRQIVPSAIKYDKHHICFCRRTWSQGEWSRQLREHPYLIPQIPRDGLHHQVHVEVSHVPVPPEWCCQRAFETLNWLLLTERITMDDPPSKCVCVLIAILGSKPAVAATTEALACQQQLFFTAEYRECLPAYSAC